MEICLDSKTHTYVVDGDIASISVTQLLKKHGLSPNYSGVDTATLNAKAEYGTRVHKALESVANGETVDEEPSYTSQFKSWLGDAETLAEQPLAINYHGLIIAGTCDLMGERNGQRFIADHKTTSSFHKESVAWQLSILDYMARHCDNINGKPFKWLGATNYYGLHYTNGVMTEKVVTKIPDEEIENLLTAELKDETYKHELSVSEDFIAKVEQAETSLAVIEMQKKNAEDIAKQMRAKLIEMMQEQGVKTYESDRIRITLVDAQERTSVDSTSLKKNFPEAYSSCLKTTMVSPSLKIKVKYEKF